MKICPKCDAEHQCKGTYCSRKCANSRTITKESRLVRSAKAKEHWASLSEDDQFERVRRLKDSTPNSSKYTLERLLYGDWNSKGYDAKRLTVILEQKGKCNRCGIDSWQGERITLEYEHKDGNNQNNNRDNVEALCPNCHSLTTTWRGRNNRVKQRKTEHYLNLSLE